MAWMCEKGHVMEKPNLVWTSRPLDRFPRTKAERNSGRRWIPHCRACEESVDSYVSGQDEQLLRRTLAKTTSLPDHDGNGEQDD